MKKAPPKLVVLDFAKEQAHRFIGDEFQQSVPFHIDDDVTIDEAKEQIDYFRVNGL